MKKVVIIGAGISGLAAGWYHKQKGNAVTIVEKSGRVGGWIRSTNEKGFLFEQGPRGFRPVGKGKRTLALIKELKLENELIPASQEARKRYLLLDGQLRPFSLRLLLRQGMVGALLRDLKTPPTTNDDETIADFCARRFNAKLTQNIIDPLVKGIFGGDAEALSMRSCFPNVWEAEQKGSVMHYYKREKAKISLYSLRNGMQRLPQRLSENLKDNLLLNTPVIGLKKGGVILPDQTLEADLIIAAIPAYALAQIAGIWDPFTYNSLTTVNLGWKGSILPKRGYGFLVPSREKEKILGMTWDSEIFPHAPNQTRLCVMIAGKGNLDMARQAVQKILKIEQEPDAFLVDEAVNAIPQYLVGHHKRLAFFQKQCDIRLIGNCYTGVGVNDCIEAAWKSASL